MMVRGVGLEPDRVEIVSRGEADVGVECGGQSVQQGDGGFGAAFLLHSISSSVISARWASSVMVRPSSVWVSIHALAEG